MVVFAFSVQEVVKKSSGHSGLQRVRERETSIIRKYTNTLSSRYYNTSMLSKCVGVFISEVLGTYKYKFRLTRTRLRSFLIKKNSLQRAAAAFVFLLFKTVTMTHLLLVMGCGQVPKWVSNMGQTLYILLPIIIT